MGDVEFWRVICIIKHRITAYFHTIGSLKLSIFEVSSFIDLVILLKRPLQCGFFCACRLSIKRSLVVFRYVAIPVQRLTIITVANQNLVTIKSIVFFPIVKRVVAMTKCQTIDYL